MMYNDPLFSAYSQRQARTDPASPITGPLPPLPAPQPFPAPAPLPRPVLPPSVPPIPTTQGATGIQPRGLMQQQANPMPAQAQGIGPHRPASVDQLLMALLGVPFLPGTWRF